MSTTVNVERRRAVELRIREISLELGLLEPSDLSSWNPAPEHDLQEIEEMYAERERLIQELEKDC